MAQDGPLKLNLGCGTNKLPGWVNVDSVKELEPDLVHDISQPLPYPDASVDEIIADGILEHFDKYLRYVVFYEWVRVLKIGGVMHVGVPNFKKLLFRYFKFGFRDFVDTLFGENMLGSEVYIGHYGNHKWGYSAETLKAFVGEFGLKILEVETPSLILRVKAEKTRHVTREEMDRTRIYACANAHGVGDAALSLAASREKINTFYRDIEGVPVHPPASADQTATMKGPV